MKTPTQKHLTGFSLIELMVTISIVAILASIATASYTSQIQKSRRTDARSAILDLAGREEKLFSTTNAYSDSPQILGYGDATTVWPVPVGSNFYSITVAIAAPTAAPTYLITATPINAQVSDTKCASLSIDQLGNQTATGTETASTCWGN
jgi:type IV pilus assembly protein PilE